MRTYQSVSYGEISFRRQHFTKEGWDWLKNQLGVPKGRFNDRTSTVDFSTFNIVFKTVDFKRPEDMAMGFYHKEGKNPGWQRRRKKRLQ